MDTLSFGTDISSVHRDSSAASNPFYESAASPTALATVFRFNTILRDAMEPISFPFGVEEVVQG